MTKTHTNLQYQGVLISGRFSISCSAAIGSSLDKIMTSNDVLTSLIVLASKINDWAHRKVTTKWSANDIKYALGSKNSNSESFDRVSTRRLIDIIMGHYIVKRMGYPGNNLCRNCLNKENQIPLMSLPKFIKCACCFRLCLPKFATS